MSNEETTNGTTAPAAEEGMTVYQQRAIALREGIGQDATPRAIVPRTFAEAQSFAGAISKSMLVPEKLRDRAPDVLMMVLAGAELGIAPIRALSMFHVIEGVPKLSADALAALVMSSPLCEYLEVREQSSERVVWAAKRKGRPHEVTLAWTKADADAAGLFKPTYNGKPSNHTKFPRQMLNARCKADLCRLVFPDVCAGLVTMEEARDEVDFRETAAPPAPTTAAGFSAPPPPAASSPASEMRKGHDPAPSTPTTPAPAKEAAPAKGQKGGAKGAKASGGVIDTTATEKPAGAPPSTSSTERSTSSASTTSSPPSGTSSSAAASGSSTGGSSPDPSNPANLTPEAKEALAKARENAAEIDKARAERAELERQQKELERDLPSTGPITTEDEAPPASPEDDFGGSDEAPTPPKLTIEAFDRDVAEAVRTKNTAELNRLKELYLPWSKDQGPEGGYAHAHRMREIYSKALTELGLKR